VEPLLQQGLLLDLVIRTQSVGGRLFCALSTAHLETALLWKEADQMFLVMLICSFSLSVFLNEYIKVEKNNILAILSIMRILHLEQGVIVFGYNLGTWEAEAGCSRVQDWPR
jgi:hypothetical protein